MERKIGEPFEYEGKKLKVEENKNFSCHGCFFNKKCTVAVKKTAGICNGYKRTDKKPVIFVEVKDEQPQEQAEQPNLNLCEILKDCPRGFKLYSTVHI